MKKLRKIFIIFFTIFLFSCNNKEINDINKLVYRREDSNNRTFELFIPETSHKENLYHTYRKWKGTPYLWGGETRLGIDCSAFMQRIYEEVYNLSIPRTTVEQMERGRNPGYKNRQTGDLIFFKTGPESFHVGVYYENDNFFHSSTSLGVTMSNLNENYWKKSYLRIRRFID